MGKKADLKERITAVLEGDAEVMSSVSTAVQKKKHAELRQVVGVVADDMGIDASEELVREIERWLFDIVEDFFDWLKSMVHEAVRNVTDWFREFISNLGL